MSPCCPEGLVGECSASDSLQTPIWSDAAAAETRMSSRVRSANTNCEHFTAKMWTDSTYTCSQLHTDFITLCGVLAARKAERGHRLDGKGLSNIYTGLYAYTSPLHWNVSTSIS